MAKKRPWTVLAHDPIEKLEENLWAVDGALPDGIPLRRRMSIVKLSDGRLVFHNAVPLVDDAMAELERWGEPAFLVVPNGYHRLDLAAFKERYPRVKLFAPTPHARRVADVAPVDGGLDGLPADPHLRAEPLAGSKIGEAALVVTSGDEARVSLLFGDTVMNLPHVPGIVGFFLRVLGSTGGPRVTFIARRVAVADGKALADHLRRLAALPGLVRLVVSHGANVEADAPAVLRGVADRLAPA